MPRAILYVLTGKMKLLHTCRTLLSLWDITFIASADADTVMGAAKYCRWNSATALYSAGGIAWHAYSKPIVTLLPNSAGALNSAGILD